MITLFCYNEVMKRCLSILFNVLLSTSIAGFCALVVIVLYTNAQLPSVNDLQDIQLQVPLRIYSADGKLIGEYGEKRRTPILIQAVPEQLKLAILATEDRRFYEHKGIDLRSIARAAVHLLISGTKTQGASTITMQVARNFFLTRKKTFGRKLNEALLALKIEKELSKDKILELYLNKIYFGKRAYGVQAAAQVYYGKTVDQLNLAQVAMLAGLPQAPSAINPINNPEAALKRRTHVLKRMLHYGFISEEAYQTALAQPLSARYHARILDLEAPYVAELARKELVEKFGTDIYTSGLSVYTTVDSRLQTIANLAVQEGLLEYDKRHGYRGPVAQLPLPRTGEINISQWIAALKNYPKTALTVPAAVLKVLPQEVQILFSNGQTTRLALEEMNWALKSSSTLSPNRILQVGDLIYAERKKDTWQLSQRPQAQAALVALHPKTGAILSMVGGFDHNTSYFNRATQATRQPGSNFKPFIYAAAFENGYTAASIINDAPIVYRNASTNEVWRPQNDSRQFYGPTRLRIALTKSRNLVTIRLLQSVGIRKAVKWIKRFGFPDNRLPKTLSLALGTATVSPLEMATGYAAFANGGFKVTPHIIQKVVNEQNQIVYQSAVPAICPECQALSLESLEPDQNLAYEADYENDLPLPNSIDQLIETQTTDLSQAATPIISPQTAYIMNSILQDAIETGTGRKVKALGRKDLAGKTGTTNDKLDAWYTGYNQSLVTSVWVGFDEPQTLREYGSQAALPIWMKFMGPALEGVPEKKALQPRGLVTVKIDPVTGLLAQPGQTNAIFEVFQKTTVPNKTSNVHKSENEAITPSSANGESLF